MTCTSSTSARPAARRQRRAVTKARLQSGDEVMFGDCRVIVTFGDVMSAQATPAPAGVGWRPPGSRLRAATRRRLRPAYAPPPPQQQYQAPAAYAAPLPAVVRRAPSFAGTPGAGAPRSRCTTARARWRCRPSSAASSPGPATCSTPKGKTTHGQGTSMMYAGLAAVALALGTFVVTAIDVGAEKDAYEQRQAGGKDAKSFVWKDRSAGSAAIVFGGLLGSLVLIVHGPQAPRQDQRELHRRLRRRRRRAGALGVHAVVVAPAGLRDRLGLRRQRHPAHDRRGVRRRPELPAAAVHPAARLQLLAAPGRLGAPRLRRDHVRGHRDAAPAHARGAVPDLAVGRAGLHGRLGRRARPVPADDLLGSAGSRSRCRWTSSTPTTAS